MFKARPYRILTVLSFSLISACGMLHEKETKPSTITQSLKSSDDCEMPEMKTLISRGRVMVPEASAWVSCFRKTIEKSFSEVKGSEADAVSAKELYRLASRGLIHLPIKTADQFDGVGGVMSLLNPDGHPSVTKAQALAVADLIKEAIDVASVSQDSPNHLDRQKTSTFLKHALALFPGKGEFTLTHVKELSTLLGDDDEALKSKIIAAFPAIRLFFRDALTTEGETRLAGSSLRELIQLGVDSYTVLDTVQNSEFPINAPKFATDHSPEILKIVDLVKTYFKLPKFTSLKAREFRSVMVDGVGTTPGLSEDALLLARRFLGQPDEDQAVSVKLLFPFLDDVKSLLGDFKSIARAFPDPDLSRTRAELLAMNDPALTSIALKAHFYLPYTMVSSTSGTVTAVTPVKRKAIPINMNPAVETMIQRYLFKKLFVAFGTPGQIDPDKGIYIPKKALSAAEERDAKNLARLFLRFATSLSHTEDDKHQNTTSDITIDDQFTVKAESVYRIMGLVGDRWFYDGNNDGYLNAEEFFSVISMFMEANRFTGFSADYYKTKDEDYWKSPVFPRTDFIHHLLDVSPNDEIAHSPYASLEGGIQHMKDPASLIHSLMSRSDEPINAFHLTGYDSPISRPLFVDTKLTDWVQGSGLVPANAILGLLDRAFLKCDLNDDNNLNWDELDCASDLLSGGLYHVAESGAINLDPGVHDGVILLAKAVYDPEIDATTSEFEKRLKLIPRQIFKLFLAQGSASVTMDQATLDSLSFSTDDLIPTVVLSARPELHAIYVAEVRNVFGDCDANHDDTYAGSAEIECVFDHAQKKWLDLLRTPEMRAQIQTILPFLTPEQIEGVINSLDFKAWFVYLVKGKLPVSNVATESSILDAFEGAIRRECPLGIPPREGGGCLQP